MANEPPECEMCGRPSSYLTASGDLCEAHAVIHEPDHVAVTTAMLGDPEPTLERWGERP